MTNLTCRFYSGTGPLILHTPSKSKHIQIERQNIELQSVNQELERRLQAVQEHKFKIAREIKIF